ncbi:AI-2E family transporter [Candidatus Roizmanbacteria bacterium]|nr:AI-2E family transporter [Candidatus Roizmanbacteria bacterium]
MKVQKIEISARTIIFTVFFLLALYFVWVVRDLLYSLFIAFIIMSALKPAVELLERKRVPHMIATLGVYMLFVLTFSFLVSLIVPPIILETGNLIKNFPAIVQVLSPSVSRFIDISSLTQYVPNVTNQLLQIASGLFSNTLFIISTLFFGYYFLAEKNIFEKLVSHFLDEHHAQKAVRIFERAEKRMSSWFWGEITLMTVVGALTFIGLTLIGMKYPLPLAVLAGLFEVLPNIGPIISALPAVIIGFSQSYIYGFSTIGLYFLVQQLENNLIVPIVMKRAVGLNPIITLIALVVGGRLGGVVGVLLAIPAYLFIEAVIIEYIREKNPAEYLR